MASRWHVVNALCMLLAQSGCVEPAEEPRSVVSVSESRTFGAAEIKSAAKRVHQAPDTDRVIRNHVAAQAREGRLVDSLNVNAAMLDGGELAWEDGSVVEEARFLLSTSTDVATEATVATAEILELDFRASMDADMIDAPQGRPLVGPGMGHASHTGGTLVTDNCQTWSVDELEDLKITGCYQLFKPNIDNSASRDYYAYNRWATATGTPVFGPDWVPAIVEIRSRPHGAYRYRVKGMSSYFPQSSSELCSQGSSLNISVGSLGLNIPLTSCADKTPFPDASQHMMGVRYDAGYFLLGDPISMSVEFEMVVWANQDGPRPVMGDYNHAKFCLADADHCLKKTGKVGW